MWTVILLSAAFALAQVQQGTYQGCYANSSVSSIVASSKGAYTYQSLGYCYGQCGTYAAYGTTAGSTCDCFNALPAGTKVSDSFCDIPCQGYGQDVCGGTGYYSVWSSGTTNPAVSGSSSSVSSILSSSTTSSPTAVISTATAGGSTIIITATPTAVNSALQSSAVASTKSSISSGAIAGIVVALVIILAAVGVGIFFFLRRRREAAEKKYLQADSSSRFGGHEKAVDQRLEPVMLDRRVSAQSLADEHDYTRKILRVVNPDT